MNIACKFVLIAMTASLTAASAEELRWVKEDSPVRIAEAYTVPPGDTLTIEAGVDVLFDAYVPFLVEGALRVRGAESDSVRFLPGTVESWAGLRFSREDSSSLSYFRVSGVDGMGWETEGDTIGNTVEDARVLFEHGVFSGNVSWKGGGLRVRNGTVLIRNSRFIENHAFEGGGLFIEGGSLVVMDSCDIMQNTVYDAVGGIAVMSNASLTVTDSRFIGNDGSWGNGALGVVDATADLNRCILAFNINSRYGCGPDDPCIASSGGAVGVHHDSLSGIPDASAKLKNCTVYGNHAHEGGSVYAVVTGSRIDIENSILWNNSSPAAARGGGIIDIRYSNVEGEAPAGEGNIIADPLFRDAANGDFRLLAASPCIDAGDPSMTGPDGSRIDMGAVQYEEGTTIGKTSVP